jgi:transcription termination factor Rho
MQSPGIITRGLVELDRQHGGYLRQLSTELLPERNDPQIPQAILHRWSLREASVLECSIGRGGRGLPVVNDLFSVNGKTPREWTTTEEFSRRIAVGPTERIKLTTGPADYSMRVIDLLCPLGKGQRALIVAPPRSGKTMLMQKIAHAVSTNHPEIDLMVLLVDERPEEVTDMRRTIKGQVFASSSDSDRENHVRLARLVLEYAKRKVEAGKEVVLLLDSLTKMGRAFNAVQRNSGKTLSGGVDSRALEIPKRIFGAARALEGGSSLTIVATALIETNSRMDELIFQEFKGTGNMELVLDRDIANERIYPAINIGESGTRREELLFGRETDRHQALRRALSRMKPKQAMLTMLKAMEQYPTNRKLLARLTDQDMSE